MDTKPKQLILIDGSSYLYRAFHALPALTNSHGEPTGAVYGVVNMLRKLLKDFDPEHIAVIFDAKGKTFRHEMYEEYKANREAMSDDLVSQIEPIHKLVEALGLPLIMVEGVEADDVIATLAKQAKQNNYKVLIITGDKDLAQLVDEDITLLDTMSNRKLDIDGVKKKFDVTPEQIIAYLALVGDSSDNVPGIPGVGPKTAAKWIKQFGSLEEIVKHAEEIKGKVGENLRANLDTLKMAEELVTVKEDVPLKQTPKNLQRLPEDKNKLIELFQQMEFVNWLKKLLNEENTTERKTTTSKQSKYNTILAEKEFPGLLSKLQQAKQICFDTETDNLDPLEAELVGISFAISEHEAFYIPLGHDYIGAQQQLNRDYVIKQLKPIFENPKISKIGQNLKYDINVLSNYNVAVQGVAFDTMLESYILNSAGKHDLDTLALKHLGAQTTSFEDVAGRGAKQLTFNKIAIDIASNYSCEDADITLQVHNALWPELEKDSKLTKVFTDIDMPLVSVLCNMEQNGVNVDIDLLNTQSAKMTARIAELENMAFKEAGQTFNLKSPKQLQEILFSKMGLPILEKTPTKQPSTSESVLQALAAQNFKLPTLILEHRTLSKLKSTYIDALPKQINPKTERIHTSYNQAVTSTGRLSSTNPNLQNIPARTEAGRKIRQAFVAPEGFKLIAADYSQVELRIMAHLSQDDGLCKAFANNEDIHRATAAEVFEVTKEDVSSEQRRRAKAINFGLIYGMSAFGLSRQLGIERGEAQKYIDIYFARYPGAKEYMENARELAREQGFVETIFGRRLYVPDINAQNFARRAAAERAAINAPMQGSAADIIKIAMINMDNFIQTNKLDIKMLMQVHDELIFEVAERDLDAAKQKITELMEHAVDLRVPLLVDVGIGNNWDEAHS